MAVNAYKCGYVLNKQSSLFHKMCKVCGGAGGRHFKPMRSGLITSQHPNSLEGLHPGHIAVNAGRSFYANKTNKQIIFAPHRKHSGIGLFERNASVI